MIKDARTLINAIGATMNEENLDVAVDVISKYGSYRSAMIEANSIKFKSKEMLLFALLGEDNSSGALAIEDTLTKKANELYNIALAMSLEVEKEHSRTGIDFDVLMNGAIFKNIPQEDIDVLDNVYPHYSHKDLASNLSLYQTSKEALDRIKEAIKKLDKKEDNLLVTDKRVTGLLNQKKEIN